MTDLDTSIISNDALALWAGFFLNPKSSLTFGGDGAENKMTHRARNALSELLEYEIIEPREPDDQIPNRESYKAAHAMHAAVHAELLARAGDDPMKWMDLNARYPTFEKVGEEKGRIAISIEQGTTER